MTETINFYEIEFPDFFKEPFSKVYSGKSAGQAKYRCYLQFSDAYDMTFGEFLKIIKCRKVSSHEQNRRD